VPGRKSGVPGRKSGGVRKRSGRVRKRSGRVRKRSGRVRKTSITAKRLSGAPRDSPGAPTRIPGGPEPLPCPVEPGTSVAGCSRWHPCDDLARLAAHEDTRDLVQGSKRVSPQRKAPASAVSAGSVPGRPRAPALSTLSVTSDPRRSGPATTRPRPTPCGRAGPHPAERRRLWRSRYRCSRPPRPRRRSRGLRARLRRRHRGSES
jgi:hypothetical protein